MQDKFARLAGELETELVERTDEIRCAMLALIAGCTFFMVGPPGLAKSLLARRIALRLTDARFFDVALDKFSTPEVLFGPYDLKALKAGRWERVTKDTLVDADFAHLDEVFEASSALLKTLLWSLNERLYRAGSTVITIPLSAVFLSSNSVPTEPRLAPLWDRMVLRRVLEPVRGAGAFSQMLLSERLESPEPVLTWAEVRQAQREADAVTVPDKVATVMFELRRQLARRAITPSDRRWVQSLAVVRASAWLEARSEAHVSDLSVLADVLWQFPDEAPTVAGVLAAVLEAHAEPSTRLLADVRAIDAEIRSGLDDPERMLLAEELGGKVRRARTELTALERGGQRMDRVRFELERVGERILAELFDGDAESLDVPPHRRGARP